MDALANSLQGIRSSDQYENTHDPYTTEQVNKINELFNYCTKRGNATARSKDLQHIFNSAIDDRDWKTADTVYAPLASLESTGSIGGTAADAIEAAICREKDPSNLLFGKYTAKSWEELGEARTAGMQKYPRNIPVVTYKTVTQATVEDLVTYVNGYSMPYSEKLLTSQQQQLNHEAASREAIRQALDSARTTIQQEDTARQMEASRNYVTDTNTHVGDTIKLMATKSALTPSVPDTVMVPGTETMMYDAETMAQIENTNGNEPEMSEVKHETQPSFPRRCGSGNVNSRKGMDTYANDTNTEHDFTGTAEEAYVTAAYNVAFGSKESTDTEEPGLLDSIGDAAMKAITSLANTAGQLGSDLLDAAGDTLTNVKDLITNVSAESLLDKVMGVTKSLVSDSEGIFSLGKSISNAFNIRNLIQTKDPLDQTTKLSDFAGNTLNRPSLSKAVDMAAKTKREGFSVASATAIGNSMTEKLGLNDKDILFNRFSKDSLTDAALFRGAMDAVKSGNPQRLDDFLSNSKVENAFKNTDMPNMLFSNMTPSTSNCNGLAKLGDDFGFSFRTTKDLIDKLGDSAQPTSTTETEHQTTLAVLKSAAIDTRSCRGPGADKKLVATGMAVDEAKLRSALAREFAVY